eukprot:1094340-Rhodomonas_salina.1
MVLWRRLVLTERYGATRPPFWTLKDEYNPQPASQSNLVLRPATALRAPYAIPGTDAAYGATRTLRSRTSGSAADMGGGRKGSARDGLAPYALLCYGPTHALRNVRY